MGVADTVVAQGIATDEGVIATLTDGRMADAVIDATGSAASMSSSLALCSFGGRLVGFVYGVSTVGNVLGTLITTFTLVPAYGSRTLTLVFAGFTVACGLVMILCDRYLQGDKA